MPAKYFPAVDFSQENLLVDLEPQPGTQGDPGDATGAWIDPLHISDDIEAMDRAAGVFTRDRALRESSGAVI